jgi:HSP20 family protein
MEIPGIKQEDLDVRLDGNTLTVSGERKFEQEEKRDRVSGNPSLLWP